MTARSILQIFDQYEKTRLNFVKTVAELALRPTNIPTLHEAKVLGIVLIISSHITTRVAELLKPLLRDVCKQIQQCATIALGRIVQHDIGIAKQFAQTDILKLFLLNLPKENVSFDVKLTIVNLAFAETPKEFHSFRAKVGV